MPYSSWTKTLGPNFKEQYRFDTGVRYQLRCKFCFFLRSHLNEVLIVPTFCSKSHCPPNPFVPVTVCSNFNPITLFYCFSLMYPTLSTWDTIFPAEKGNSQLPFTYSGPSICCLYDCTLSILVFIYSGYVGCTVPFGFYFEKIIQ